MLKQVFQYIDHLIHDVDNKDSLYKIRARATALLALLSICYCLVIVAFIDVSLDIVFIVAGIGLTSTLVALKFSSSLSTIGWFSLTFCQTISMMSYVHVADNLGLINIHLFWPLVFLVAAPLIGGSFLGTLLAVQVIIGTNLMVYFSVEQIPLELTSAVKVQIVEWNVMALMIYSIAIVFERSLSHQIDKIENTMIKLETQRSSALLAAQLASLGEMAGGIAHEINNPLAIVHGNAMILSKLAEKEGHKIFQKRATAIVRTSGRIQEVTSAMKKLSRQEIAGNDMNHIRLADVLGNAIVLFQERVKNMGCELLLNFNPDQTVYCNQVLMGQVFINLLNNAIDAMEAYPELEKYWVEIKQTSDPDNKIRLCFRNAGPKIPKEIVTRVMDPFFTTKDIGKGTGLGLSLSQRIIAQHQGKLYVDEADSVTSFVVELHSQKPDSADNEESKLAS